MPRYNHDLTKVRVFPECPSDVAAFKREWDQRTAALLSTSPLLTATLLAAVIRRRWQEAIARLAL